MSTQGNWLGQWAGKWFGEVKKVATEVVLSGGAAAANVRRAVNAGFEEIKRRALKRDKERQDELAAKAKQEADDAALAKAKSTPITFAPSDETLDALSRPRATPRPAAQSQVITQEVGDDDMNLRLLLLLAT